MKKSELKRYCDNNRALALIGIGLGLTALAFWYKEVGPKLHKRLVVENNDPVINAETKTP